jgi:hypothetical protein
VSALPLRPKSNLAESERSVWFACLALVGSLSPQPCIHVVCRGLTVCRYAGPQKSFLLRGTLAPPHHLVSGGLTVIRFCVMELMQSSDDGDVTSMLTGFITLATRTQNMQSMAFHRQKVLPVLTASTPPPQRR